MGNFFVNLINDLNSGFITIWEKVAKQSAYFNLSDPQCLEKIEAHIEKLIQAGKDVYFGICTRKEDLGPNKRGALDDIFALPAVWADVDLHLPGHANSTDYPETVEKALQLIENSGLPQPSVIVHTGGGLHIYWLLTAPLMLTSNQMRNRAERLVKGIQGKIRKVFQHHGYKLDATADLPRILRVPCTINYKLPENPRPVEIMEELSSWERFDLEALELLLDPTPDEPKTAFAPCYKQYEGNAYVAMRHCVFLQYCKKEAKSLPEPLWHAMINNLAPLEEGAKLIHELSSPYPQYNPEETEEKLHRGIENPMPHTCEYIQKESGFTGCPFGGCPVKAPIGWATSQIGKALDAVESFLEDADSTIDSIFDQKMRYSLAILQVNVPADYHKSIILLERRFKKDGFSKRQLQNAIKVEVERILKHKTDSNQQENLQELERISQILGFNAILPEGYVFHKGKIGKLEKDSISPIEGRLVFPSAFFDGEEQLVELTYDYGNEDWRQCVVQRSEISSLAEIVQLSNIGLPFNANTAKQWIGFLSNFINENAGVIPVRKSTKHYGWQKDGSFLPGFSEFVVIPTGKKFPINFATWQTGTLNEWIRRVQPALNEPFVRLILCASFAAPLADFLGVRTFIIHIFGPSQGGKTAAMTLAASVWGKPKEQMMNFNATRFAIEKTAAERHNLPLIIDERQAIGDNQSFLDGLVYLIGEGQGKARGKRDQSVQQGDTWCTTVITSGEDPLSDVQSRQGVKTRALEFYTEKVFTDNNLASEMYQLERIAYGTAGPAFISWIQENKQYVQEIFADLEEKIKNNYSSLSLNDRRYFTILAVTYLIQSHLFFECDRPTSYENLVIPDFLPPLIDQRMVAQNKNDSEIALNFIRSEFAINHMKFYRAHKDSNGKMQMYCADQKASASWGWTYNSDVYVHTNIMREIAKSGQFHLHRFMKDAIQNKWIKIGHDRDSITSSITVTKPGTETTHRMYCFPNFWDGDKPDYSEFEAKISTIDDNDAPF